MGDEAQEYKLTLSELASNNKTQINLLTILAEDYKHAAAEIVDVLEAHLHTVPPPLKLTVMYVCDSILKNVKDIYTGLFNKRIIPMFIHVFQHSDEKTRAMLYKLRVTWSASNVFLQSKLYQLDMKVNSIDTAWPINNPKKSESAPNPAQPSSSSASSSTQASNSNARIFVNRKFIQEAPKPSVAAAGKPVPRKVAPPVVKKENKSGTVDPLDKLLPTTTPPSSSSSGIPLKRKIEPSAVKVEKRSPPSRAAGSPLPPPKRRTLDEDLRGVVASRGDKDFRQQMPAIKPTSVAGTHAFVAPPQQPRRVSRFSPAAVPIPPGPPMPPMMPPMPNVSLPPIIPPPSSRAPLLPSPPMAAASAAYPPDIRQIETTPPPEDRQTVITNEAVKLDIPQNNRIFVDGKCYEVMFIDDTAVIERAGAPHRICFHGPPRKILIDGVPHMLPFGEAKDVKIGDTVHALKFGAPSRELYMGKHPFKGQFGGPPIIATINGRRHEIRLTGSAPEVKIEPDPAYDLARFLNKMREEKKVEMKQEKTKEEDPFAFIRRLAEKGLLKPASPPVVQIQQPPKPQQSFNRLPLIASAPNLSASVSMLSSPTLNGSGIERRALAPSLKEFNARLLKIRYDDVIEKLLKKRDDCCDLCGLKMANSSPRSKEWIEHKDWHVKQNLSKQVGSQYRQWYPTASKWLKPKDQNGNVAGEKENNEEQNAPVAGVISSSQGQKECAICAEKFDEYYDHDEEIWRLRDTVEIKGKVVHVACSSDASLLETPTTTMSTASELEDGPELKTFIKTEPNYSNDSEDVKPIIAKKETKYSLNDLNGR